MSSIHIRLYIANTMPLDGLVCMSEHLIARTYILPTTTCALHVYILHVYCMCTTCIYMCIYCMCTTCVLQAHRDFGLLSIHLVLHKKFKLGNELCGRVNVS